MKLKMFILMVTLISPSIQASEIYSATVNRLMMDRIYPGKLFIGLEQHQTSPTNCHTNSGWEYVLDISDDHGKQMHSNLLTLYASGKKGRFIGTDICNLIGTIETLRRIELK